MTLSFADAYFEGEQLTRYRRGYNPSQAMFTVGYSGLPWGWRAIYWGKQIHNYNGIASAVCYSLLFNSEYMINPNTEPIDFDVKLLEEYSGPEAEFHPFWKKHTAIDFKWVGKRWCCLRGYFPWRCAEQQDAAAERRQFFQKRAVLQIDDFVQQGVFRMQRLAVKQLGQIDAVCFFRNGQIADDEHGLLFIKV